MGTADRELKQNCWRIVSSMGQQGSSRSAIKQLLLEDGMPEEMVDETLGRYDRIRKREVGRDKISGCGMITLALLLVLLIGPIWGGLFGGATLLAGTVALFNGIAGSRKLGVFRRQTKGPAR